MADSREILYCVFLPAGRERSLVDAIRLIANPAARHAAHITVRGPYTDYQDPRPWVERLRQGRVTVSGAGLFPPPQATAFLRVESQVLRDLFHKPQYPDGVLHITLYDGTDPAFAEAIVEAVGKAEPRFTFQPTGLEPLVRRRGYGELRYSYDPQQIAEVIEQPPSMAEIDAADKSQRLAWIEQLAAGLSGVGCPA